MSDIGKLAKKISDMQKEIDKLKNSIHAANRYSVEVASRYRQYVYVMDGDDLQFVLADGEPISVSLWGD